jgi:hypothetical protein
MRFTHNLIDASPLAGAHEPERQIRLLDTNTQAELYRNGFALRVA